MNAVMSRVSGALLGWILGLQSVGKRYVLGEPKKLSSTALNGNMILIMACRWKEHAIMRAPPKNTYVFRVGNAICT